MLNHKEFSQRLLDWFYREKRDLPWRRENDPYRIWVSEIMLQQTRVETVIPYYERFMEKFPTLDDLALAPLEEVLKCWEGLGYYSRARNLHAAVREVRERYGGIVPDDEEEIAKLKGIGSYTRGAILSIAYQKPVPAVDGNVMRVISRTFNIEKDITKPSTKTEMEKLIRKIIPHHDPSGFNQALMELGALVCTPRNPSCLLCPVSDLCEGRLAGKESVLPIKTKKESKRDVHLVTLVISNGEQVLIRRREENLLKGLWEFPSFEADPRLKPDKERLANEVASHLHILVDEMKMIGRVTHIFSHLRWKMDVYLMQIKDEMKPLDHTYQWVAFHGLDLYPFPVPHQKVRKLWEKEKAAID